ncbi:hypothetical protein BH23ACI1_BH23ACI1_13500 [soil metagenome]
MVFAHCLILLMTSVAVPAPEARAAAQPPPQPSSTSPQKTPAQTVTVDPDALPVSLDRIQRALAKTPRLIFDERDRPMFRVEVFGDQPTIEDILGPDWATGPVRHGSMTHQEFLNLVTPRDVQGYAAFSNEEGATVAATSFLLQWTLQKAIRNYHETTDERAREAARKEVLDALSQLEKARGRL